jgi:DNA-binding LacI/PurR family transcriptional regulator
MDFEILSPSEQLAEFLRGQLYQGTWTEALPGTPTLAAELGVDRKTIMAAYNILEDEGILKSQGAGRPRRINLPSRSVHSRLNIQMFPYEDSDMQRDFVLQMIHEIKIAGHQLTTAEKSLVDMGMDVNRVARYVSRNKADAYLVGPAASREVLEWFAAKEQPTFAIFGRRRQVSIASVGPNKELAIRKAVSRLVELGHQRIVYLAREERRKPNPGYIEQCYLDELQCHGISAGSYNLPDWKDTPASFHECIASLFRHTPPTAIILDESQFYIAAQQQLSQMGLVVPRDVSLICSDAQPLFDWCQPAISHIRWDAQPVIRETLRWIRRVAQGKKDLRKAVYTPSEFVEGGTIGPAAGAT